MSGGSFDYLYNRIEETYREEMHDAELNELLIDFCKVLHDLEWWQSYDYSEGQYRLSVERFKKKWLKGHGELVPLSPDERLELFNSVKALLPGLVDGINKALPDIVRKIDQCKTCGLKDYFNGED